MDFFSVCIEYIDSMSNHISSITILKDTSFIEHPLLNNCLPVLRNWKVPLRILRDMPMIHATKFYAGKSLYKRKCWHVLRLTRMALMVKWNTCKSHTWISYFDCSNYVLCLFQLCYDGCNAKANVFNVCKTTLGLADLPFEQKNDLSLFANFSTHIN